MLVMPTYFIYTLRHVTSLQSMGHSTKTYDQYEMNGFIQCINVCLFGANSSKTKQSAFISVNVTHQIKTNWRVQTYAVS